jgi:hypothetical protein
MDPHVIRSIGLKSCELCWRVSLVGQGHPANCLGVENTPESSQTRSAIQAMLTSACLIKTDYAKLDFVANTSWQEVFERRVLVYDRFPKSQSLLTAWSEIFLSVTRQCFDPTSTPEAREACWKLFYMLPWLLFQRPVGRSTKSPSVLMHERVQLFLSANWVTLVASAKACSTPSGTFTYAESNGGDPHAIRMKKVMAKARAGDITKATQLLFSDASFLDTQDETTAAKVQSVFIPARVPSLQVSAQSDGANSIQPLGSASTQNVHSATHVPTPTPPPISTTTASIPAGSSITSSPSPLDSDCIATAISRSHRAAAGPSGWHISVIKALTCIKACADRIGEILQFLLHGQVPINMLKHLQVGSLTALSKPNGGVRPIVTRDTWLRLLSKCIVVSEQPKLASHLPPVQAGVGLQGGTEFIIHTVRRLLNTHSSWCLVAIDCTNAYGTIHRDKIKHALTSISTDKDCSLALAYFNRYCDAALAIRSHPGRSWSMAEGVIQGDPLSPLLFALALQQTLLDTQACITNASHDAHVFAYLDDVYLIGPASAVNAAFTKFTQQSELVGLKTNPTKTQVLCPTLNETSHDPDIDTLVQQHALNAPVQCITVLGSPVGKPSLENQVAVDLVDESKFQRLCQVPNKQIRLAMLRHSISTTHNHLVRALPPSCAQVASQKHDSLVDSVVASLLDMESTNMSTVTKSEFRLPVRMGGLGLTPLSTTSEHAYLSSLWLTINSWRKILPDTSAIIQALTAHSPDDPLASEFNNTLQHASNLVQQYIQFTSGTSATPRGLHITLPKAPPDILKSDMPHRLYHHLNSMQFDIAAARLFNNSLTTDNERAQFRSKQGFSAGAFLQALPSDKFLQFNNTDFTLALRTWLRLPILPVFNLQGSEACHCRRIDVTTLADTVCDEIHLLNCHGSSLLSKRHDALVYTFQAMAQSCKLKPVLEPLAHVQSNSQHRFDIAIDRAESSSASNLKLDITVRNPQAKNIVSRAARYFMYAANEGASQKNAFYKRHLTPSDRFVPLVFETFGAMHQQVRDFVSLMAKLANNMPPADSAYTSPTFTAYWFQRLSVTLWRENARMIAEVAGATKRSTENSSMLLMNSSETVGAIEADFASSDVLQSEFPPLPAAASAQATTFTQAGRQ